ncbi:MAG: class I SAM-dependent rRNA methyltransferase [Verrucomicrobia bacterium]|nr:class I SAM-dependent rRNA methyltransferase [Verrucomicrobiota bacterium]
MPDGSDSWPRPWVQLKYFNFHPNFFPNMIGAADAAAGDLVTVMDRDGQPFGHGFYNPHARVPLRIIQHGAESLAEDHLEKMLLSAVKLRTETLRLPETTDAFRVVHSDADGIPGLMVDKFADVLSVEITTLAAWQRIESWLPLLHEKLGTQQTVLSFDERAADAERVMQRSIDEVRARLSSEVASVRIQENGVRFNVNFESGHKTGFFCDQRDNRAQFARWTKGLKVLDLCCYTGGFAVSAKAGGADEVTGVDLDEKAIEVAKKNANLNIQRVSFVHADAFTWMRQMQKNGETWEAVVLDPPKLIHSRDGFEEGRAKYHDLNKLALSLVTRGGLFATFSCSGLMSVEEFEDIVIGLAHRNGRKLQILDRTGAGPDHPVMSHCPESRYLKALWARVW